MNEQQELRNENTAVTIRDLKKGDACVRMMERHNPQLGVYFTYEKRTVKSIATKSIRVTGGYEDESYDLESGDRKKKSNDVYGSSYYSLITLKEATNDILAVKESIGRFPRNDMGFDN